MHRILPDIGVVDLPTGINRADRARFAGGLDDLVELITSTLTLAVMRKTGRLPILRCASNARVTAVCAHLEGSVSLPPPLVFSGLFVDHMLRVWDAHGRRDPEEASTYLCVTGEEYVVGIGARALVEAVARDRDEAVDEAVAASTRITAVWHGGH